MYFYLLASIAYLYVASKSTSFLGDDSIWSMQLGYNDYWFTGICKLCDIFSCLCSIFVRRWLRVAYGGYNASFLKLVWISSACVQWLRCCMLICLYFSSFICEIPLSTLLARLVSFLNSTCTIDLRFEMMLIGSRFSYCVFRIEFSWSFTFESLDIYDAFVLSNKFCSFFSAVSKFSKSFWAIVFYTRWRLSCNFGITNFAFWLLPWSCWEPTDIDYVTSIMFV